MQQKDDQSLDLQVGANRQPPAKDQTDIQQLEDELDLELIDDEDELIITGEHNIHRSLKEGETDGELPTQDSSSNDIANKPEQLQLDEEEEDDDAEESEDRSWRR